MSATIILTVSRSDFLPEVITSLELLECDHTYVNLLCIVDGDAKLYTQVRNLVQDTKFNERLTVQFKSSKPVKRFDYIARRNRITAIHNFAKTQVGIADYVLLVEDDTIIPPNTLKTLYTAMSMDPAIVFAEGAEVGRWGIPYIGAWQFDDVYNPTKVTSLSYERAGMEYIDAGGFYCSLIKADIYKSHEFETYESLGPDISMGLKLRQKGYQCVIDWSVPCKHMYIDSKQQRQILVPSEDTKQTTLERKNKNNWAIVY